MSFPISFYQRRYIVKSLTLERYGQYFFAIASRRIKPSVHLQVEHDKKHLRFKGSLFRFAWNGFHFLNGISKATLWIEQSEKNEDHYVIHQRLYFTEFFIICLLFGLLPLAFWDQLASLIAAFILLLLYFIGCLIFIIRFNIFIGRVLAQLYDDHILKQAQRK